MVKQPELGQIISDSRKAKGFTQEELVEKCNLSVRTLQRIESGEATPKLVTVKLILEALDLDYNSFIDQSIKMHNKTHLELTKNFIDLFNFKTNAMRKISVLSILFSFVGLGLFILIKETKAQHKKALFTHKNIEINKQSDTEIKEGYFSCTNCFYDNDEMIGYKVKFKKDGVIVNVQLLKLNTTSGKFNAGFAKGYLQSNKVETFVPKEWIDKKILNFEANDSLIYKDDKIILYGKSKLQSSKNEYIEANKITIIYE